MATITPYIDDTPHKDMKKFIVAAILLFTGVICFLCLWLFGQISSMFNGATPEETPTTTTSASSTN